MLRNKISIERQINERLYQFMVPFEAPSWKEVLMIHDDIRSYVVEMMKQEDEKRAAEAAEKAKSEAIPVVEPVVV